MENIINDLLPVKIINQSILFWKVRGRHSPAKRFKNPFKYGLGEIQIIGHVDYEE